MVLSTQPAGFPSNWDTWVWNKDYKGSLTQAEGAFLTVDKVYTHDTQTVAVYRRGNNYYVQPFDEGGLHELCSRLAVQHLSELEGKTVEAYVTDTEIVRIKAKEEIPPQVSAYGPL